MLEPRAAPDQFAPTLFVGEVGAVDQALTPRLVTDFVIMEEPLSLLAADVPVHIGGAVVKIVSSNFHLRVKFHCGILKSGVQYMLDTYLNMFLSALILSYDKNVSSIFSFECNTSKLRYFMKTCKKV